MSERHQARKRFGQHFLTDAGVIGRIVAAVAPQPGEALVEIGPGLGAITRPLLAAAGHLDVVELDRDVIPHLQRRCAGAGELVVHGADALDFDFGALAAPGRPLRLVGNLPYNISTPLLFHLLGFAGCVRDMHFMLQKEVVMRLAAGPDEPDYGRLSVMVQLHCEVVPLFEIGPEAFSPPPRVDSAVVRLLPRATPAVAVAAPQVYAEVVRRAFAQRRKTLRNALQGLLSAAAIAEAGVDPGARGETLSLADFAALANRVAGAGPAPLTDV
ncbi:dimethyladenosine transferase [Plasticicumulans lactativorans]|uniref:Ribosomal RNA small subunit methyltransferase A n=1 Tax=Plasticicumulans lactativorans TaxID=1133106 RepID=A0A4R2L812_9GAMM|nr:16S rRNA (adenine(1518)-N(6)/adenine(1519)-N(6))-dimethyltransferase RsmA [Plasticicumulans lactativorans]TCO82796.1 dimethyladenosine transferase [Plasticicumulans lactativorans]